MSTTMLFISTFLVSSGLGGLVGLAVLLSEEQEQVPQQPATPPPARKEQLRLLEEGNDFHPAPTRGLTPNRSDEGQRETMR